WQTGGARFPRRAVPMADFPEQSVLFGANAVFIAELYARYVQDPAAVDPSWVEFFAELGDDARALVLEAQGGPRASSPASVIGQPDPDAPAKPKGKETAMGGAPGGGIDEAE